ncbi:MAG: histidyl-tRNA synthetase [Candidatus Woesearchaeota archaeon]|nr:histidyl-tRNA synthetase [Candidatus Woesearchaeota archaeon]
MGDTFSCVKGMKDWYGAEALERERIVSILRKTFKAYGFSPLETPHIEYVDVLTKKGGQEIQKEIYYGYDQAGRKFGLRFDLTVPLARFVATKKTLKLPYKRYSIGEVFRDGASQPEQGRYRCITQCDVDIVGVKEMCAEAELITLACDVLNKIGLTNVEIRLNNRKLLNGLMTGFGVKKELLTSVLIALDKFDKIGFEGVSNELKGINGLKEEEIKKILKMMKLNGTNEEILKELEELAKNDIAKEGIKELREILSYLDSQSVVKIAPYLARGLDYYTGPVMEGFSTTGEIKSSILGGGRYDKMIGDFIGTNEKIHAVGFSFGLERITSLLKKDKEPENISPAQIFIVPLDNLKESFKIAKNLREAGINVDVELKKRNLKKSLSYAESLGIPYVGFIGEDEIKKGLISVKDLKKRVQQEMSIEELKKKLKEEKT